ncbi:CHC2 zinc finger domain-containing protein [Alkalibacillus haloalkaliphilus]|uniref:CHC2 zinc finger domain-containing protein n=1 Tax=Alkalibacillus haloalkaliphilus TaxID=94136 RepID=UPI0034E0378A
MSTKEELLDAKRNLDLIHYIKSQCNTKDINVGRSTFLVPCPFCGSGSRHFSVDRKKNLYHSFNGCVPPGSIVDYLINAESLSVHEAIVKAIKLNE